METILNQTTIKDSITAANINLLRSKQSAVLSRAASTLFNQRKQLLQRTLTPSPPTKVLAATKVSVTTDGLTMALNQVQQAANEPSTVSQAASQCHFQLTLDASSTEVAAMRQNGSATVLISPLPAANSSVYGVQLLSARAYLQGLPQDAGYLSISLTKTGADRFVDSNGLSKVYYNQAEVYETAYDTTTGCPTSQAVVPMLGGAPLSDSVMVSPYGLWSIEPRVDRSQLRGVSEMRIVFSVSYFTLPHSEQHSFFCAARGSVDDCECGALTAPAGCVSDDSQACIAHRTPPPPVNESEAQWKVAKWFLVGILGVLVMVMVGIAVYGHRRRLITATSLSSLSSFGTEPLIDAAHKLESIPEE